MYTKYKTIHHSSTLIIYVPLRFDIDIGIVIYKL